MRRHGFVVAPRVVFPTLILVVAVMFLIFASLDGQNVPAARILGTAIVGAAILILFAVLAILSRGRRERDSEKVTRHATLPAGRAP
jgi:hypothetical protein